MVDFQLLAQNKDAAFKQTPMVYSYCCSVNNIRHCIVLASYYKPLIGKAW